MSDFYVKKTAVYGSFIVRAYFFILIFSDDQ